MMKQAWRSYLASLHPRNIKNIKESSSSTWILYWTVFYPILIVKNANNEDFVAYTVYSMLKILPVLLMSWSNISSRFLMHKAMFLCPMKREERAEYLSYVYLFKIGVPTLVGLGIEMIWNMIYTFNPWRMLAMVIIYTSVGIATYTCFENQKSTGEKVSFARRNKNGEISWSIRNMVLLIGSLILLIGFEITDLTNQATDTSNMVLTVILAIFVVVDIVILASQYKDTVEQICDYEANFKITKKIDGTINYDLFAK